MLIFSCYYTKVVKFAAFRGTTQEFAVVSQFREFCEFCDGRKKFTALPVTEHGTRSCSLMMTKMMMIIGWTMCRSVVVLRLSNTVTCFQQLFTVRTWANGKSQLIQLSLTLQCL